MDSEKTPYSIFMDSAGSRYVRDHVIGITFIQKKTDSGCNLFVISEGKELFGCLPADEQLPVKIGITEEELRSLMKQYWKDKGKWLQDSLSPLVNEYIGDMSIVGYVPSTQD